MLSFDKYYSAFYCIGCATGLLTDKMAYEACYKSQNVVLLHIKLNQLKHRKTLTSSMISYNGARIKVIFLHKEAAMFKLKG